MDTELIIGCIGNIRDKANAFLMRELRSHNMPGIAPSHGDILWALFTCEELPMKEIAAIIGRDKSTVTALVKKLIDLGYVQKKGAVNDCRINLIALAPKGKALEQDFWDISKNLRKKAYKGFSQEEKEAMMKLLVKMMGNF